MSVLNIQSVEWGNNPLNTGSTTTIKVSVVKIDSSLISCSDNTICGNYNCGQQTNGASNLQP